MDRKKSLAANSLYSVIYKIVNVLYPLFTATYIARVLLPDGVGKVAYAQNIVQYFVVIAALGIPNYGIKEIAKIQTNKEKVNSLFSELFVINFISTSICVFLYYSMVLMLPFFNTNRTLFCAAGITLVLNYFNVDWFYQGNEEYAYIAKRNCFVKVLSLILVFVLIRDVSDYIEYALIYSLTIAGNYIFNIYSLKSKVVFSLKNLRLRRHLKPIFILLASSISIELYTLLDTTMLGFLCNDDVVGYYTNAVKMARIINSTISSIALVLLPRLSFYYSNGMHKELEHTANRVLKIMISLTFPAAIGLFILADDIILVLFGASFMPAIITLRILSVLVIAVALNNYFGTQILMTFDLEHCLLISVLVGAFVNIFLNAILIPIYAQNGAAVASAISELCVMFMTFLFARRFIRFSISVKYWVSLFISSLTMTAIVSAVKFLDFSYFLELSVGIVLGFLVFAVTGALLRNEAIMDILFILKKLFVNLKYKFIRG